MEETVIETRIACPANMLTGTPRACAQADVEMLNNGNNCRWI